MLSLVAQSKKPTHVAGDRTETPAMASGPASCFLRSARYKDV